MKKLWKSFSENFHCAKQLAVITPTIFLLFFAGLICAITLRPLWVSYLAFATCIAGLVWLFVLGYSIKDKR